MEYPGLRGGLSVAIIGEEGALYEGSHRTANGTEIIPGTRVAVGLVPGDISDTEDARNIDSHIHLGISYLT